MAVAGRKRIYSAFSRALKGRGFIFDGDVATSSDNSIKVEFVGSEWNLFIDNKLILTHPMESGSMKQLERTVSVHRKKSSVKKLSKSELPKQNNKDSILPNLDRITVRKMNKQKGLNTTRDQRELKQSDSPTDVQVTNFYGGAIKLGFIPTRDYSIKNTKVLASGDCLIHVNIKKGLWKLWSYDRLLGEGICSSQGVETIDEILEGLV